MTEAPACRKQRYVHYKTRNCKHATKQSGQITRCNTETHYYSLTVNNARVVVIHDNKKTLAKNALHAMDPYL